MNSYLRKLAIRALIVGGSSAALYNLLMKSWGGLGISVGVPLNGNALPPFIFDYLDTTTLRKMALRDGPSGVWATAPIVQGNRDGSGVPDSLTHPRGDLIHGYFYGNIDSNQGSMVLLITPEWDGDDGVAHVIIDGYAGGILMTKNALSQLILTTQAGSEIVDVSGWTAGTTYLVVARWDCNNPIDWINHVCLSINDSHYFDGDGGSSNFPRTVYVGSGDGPDHPSSVVIEGLTVYRRPLFDGAYGRAVNFDASGPLDELAEIYNSGTFRDPVEVTGPDDVVFCLPGSGTPGELATGTGNAWSYPHSSTLADVEQAFLTDGGYLGGEYAYEFNGSTTRATVSDGAAIQDLQDNAFTAEMWVRPNSLGENNLGTFFRKARYGTGWEFNLTNGSSIKIQGRVFCATTLSLIHI